MEKVKEIELLQSFKGDTYFAQLFGDKQIDAMCENIKNDYPIELGLNFFEGSSVAKENAELKKRLADIKHDKWDLATNLLFKAGEHPDNMLEDIAVHLIGYKECLTIKLQSGLPLSEDDRVALVKLLAEQKLTI